MDLMWFLLLTCKLYFTHLNISYLFNFMSILYRIHYIFRSMEEHNICISICRVWLNSWKVVSTRSLQESFKAMSWRCNKSQCECTESVSVRTAGNGPKSSSSLCRVKRNQVTFSKCEKQTKKICIFSAFPPLISVINVTILINIMLTTADTLHII